MQERPHLTPATVTGDSFGATININAFRRSCGIVLALTVLLVQRPTSFPNNIHAERACASTAETLLRLYAFASSSSSSSSSSGTRVSQNTVWQLVCSQLSWPLTGPNGSSDCVSTVLCPVLAEYSTGR